MPAPNQDVVISTTATATAAGGRIDHFAKLPRHGHAFGSFMARQLTRFFRSYLCLQAKHTIRWGAAGMRRKPCIQLSPICIGHAAVLALDVASANVEAFGIPGGDRVVRCFGVRARSKGLPLCMVIDMPHSGKHKRAAAAALLAIVACKSHKGGTRNSRSICLTPYTCKHIVRYFLT